MNVTSVRVTTNSFEITRLPTATFTLYDAFIPEIPKNAWRKRSELVHHLQNVVEPSIFSPKFLYDGGAIGYAHQALRVKLGDVRDFRVRLRDHGIPKQGDKNVVVIRFHKTLAEQITATEINHCLLENSSGVDTVRRSSLLNFMQLIVRQASNNLHPNNGKAYFAQNQGHPVSQPGGPPDRRQHGSRDSGPLRIQGTFLELRRGIFHSVRPALNRATIVVDTVVAAFYQSGSLIDGLIAFFRLRDVRDLGRIDPRGWQQAKKFFKNVVIVERKGNPPRDGGRRLLKSFNEKGVSYEFENQDGHMVTIEAHYSRVHNMVIRHRYLPGVVLREGPRPEIVPMEFCYIQPDQLYKRTLPENATRDMVSFATLKPFEKLERIKQAANHYQQSEALREAGMAVNPQPITVDAGLITPPQIEFGRNSKIVVRDGKWNVVRQKLLNTVGICHWGVMNLAPTKMRPNELNNHLGTLKHCANELGIPLQQPIHMAQADTNQGPVGLIKSLYTFMEDVKQQVGEPYEAMLRGKQFFILFILEEEAAGPRATLKYWGDVEAGVVTQCVRVNKLNKLHGNSASQYWNNVALKINPRMGGENSRVLGSNAMVQIKSGVTMIVGTDVGHPSPGVRKPSVASMVYNQDKHGTKYTALTRIQDPRMEMIVELEHMFRIALVDLMNIAKAPIQNIIIFRDGVSEGEYDTVVQSELGSIDQAISHVWDSHPNLKGRPVPKPKVSFIVVGKRHHSLLFPAEGHLRGSVDLNDGKGNCKAGVVVNSGITQPTIKDFFLQSHAAIIGTSRSSHYIVLKDEVFNDTHKLEELAYALCHVYAKATRSVSIPAPVYYADLVCGRESFHFAPLVEEKLREDDNTSVMSGGKDAPFNIEPWIKAFKNRHERLQGNMYFL